MRLSTLRIAAATAFFLSAYMLLGCTEPRSALTTTTRVPAAVSRSLAAGDLTFGCLPRPSVSRRAVQTGTLGDRNGNGLVCDERVGAPGHERILTTDDLLMPASHRK